MSLIRVCNFAVGMMWVGLLLYWWIAAFTVKKNVGVNWRGLAMRLLYAVAVGLAFRLHLVDFQRHALFAVGAVSASLHLLGVALCAVGMALAVWARRHLRRNWGMPLSVKAEPELVTSGPYQFVRHPIYAGFLLASLGSAIMDGTHSLGLILIVAAWFTWYSVSEDRYLKEQFPKQYPAYQRHTKMLIPGVF